MSQSRLRLTWLLIIVVAGVLITAGVTSRAGFQFTTPSIPVSGFEPPTASASPPPEIEDVEPEETEKSNVVLKALGFVAFLVLLALLRVAQRKLTSFLGERRATERLARSGSELEEAPELNEQLIPEVHTALSLGLDLVRSQMPPRNAIVAAWQALEAAAENSGFERSPSFTPTEFTVGILEDLDLPSQELTDLLRLFHQARFTDHEITELDAQRASEILHTLREDLMALPAQPVGGEHEQA